MNYSISKVYFSHQTIAHFSSNHILSRICDFANKNRDVIFLVLDDEDERAVHNNVLLLSKGCREESDFHSSGSSAFCSLLRHLGKIVSSWITTTTIN